MNRRERFIKTMTFGEPDRPAEGEHYGFDATRERWEREGLPKDADIDEYFDLDVNVFRWRLPASIEIVPTFPEEVVEETDVYLVERRRLGEVVRTRKDVPQPAMPQWLRYPLETREDWEEYKKRLDPNIPERLSPNFDKMVNEWREKELPVGIWIGGTYGYMRNWWGVETISTLFYDDITLVEDMLETLTNLSLGLLDRVLARGARLDWIGFWEDMAYKNGSLLSPAMYKKYCIPYYKKMMEKVRAAGIPVALLDSDGDDTELIPLWLDEGIHTMFPLEVASGMDVIKLRREYGKRILFIGGIDKRVLARTREEIEKEVLPKLEACYEDGGFIAMCDHAVPPDVPFDNYRYYRELVRRTGERIYGG